jgi:hypothetical protein
MVISTHIGTLIGQDLTLFLMQLKGLLHQLIHLLINKSQLVKEWVLISEMEENSINNKYSYIYLGLS